MRTTTRAGTLRRLKPDGAALRLFALPFLIVLAAGGRAAGEPHESRPYESVRRASRPQGGHPIVWARSALQVGRASLPASHVRLAQATQQEGAVPSSAPGPANPNQPPPGTILLLLPYVTGKGGEWIAPWTHPAEAARFAKLEGDLAARFKALGYGVITAREALATPSARAALQDVPSPITPEAAASAARAAGATAALLLRAEALHRAQARTTFTDALVTTEIYRAADAVKLAWASTRVSGGGPTEAESDAVALSQVAPPLVESLARPLLVAAQRPVVAPRPLAILIEGNLPWRDYRRLLGLLQHEIPEIRELHERRFSHGRQTLRAICACEPWDIAQRLDGRTTGGFAFAVRSGLGTVRVQARPLGPGGPPP